MAKRRDFFVSATAVGLVFLGADAGAAAASPTATPSTPATAGPAPAALAAAAAMRRFDPALSDAALTSIARSIDDNAKLSRRLNPVGHPLPNGAEPVTVFRAEPS